MLHRCSSDGLQADPIKSLPANQRRGNDMTEHQFFPPSLKRKLLQKRKQLQRTAVSRTARRSHLP